MKILRYCSLAIFIFVLGISTTFAGIVVTPLDVFSVSADCDSVTVTWGPEGDGGESYVFIQAFPGGLVYYDEFFEGSGGKATFSLSPALEDGDLLYVSAERTAGTRFSDTVIAVSCDGESAEASATIELCADGRTNSNLCEPLAIYPVESEDGTGILIYYIPRGTDVGELMVYVAAEDVANLPESVDSACTIAASANGYVVVYLLPTGEIQVNAGPDEEGKVFVYRYENFPETPVIETYLGEALPIFPAC